MTTKIKDQSNSKVLLRKAKENLTKAERYEIIDHYIYSGMSLSQIAEKFNTSADNINLIVERHTKALLNIRESKALLSYRDPQVHAKFCKEVLDPDQINKPFLEKLSEPDSLYLSDAEVVYCELFNYNGDDIVALEKAKLNVGLKKAKDPKDREEYKQSLMLRSFYLKRKPNVAAYLTKLQEEKVRAIVDGKGFIQSELLAVIERIRNSEGDKHVANHLKAISELGRTLGAFEEKVVIENINADSAIDKILQRAKEAKARIIEQEENTLIEQ